MAHRSAEGQCVLLPGDKSSTHEKEEIRMATKAQIIYERVQQMMSEGVAKSDAFKTIAAEEKRPYDSVRGSFYAHKSKIEGGTRTPRPRSRETTPDAALEDARASLERSIEAIDREVEVAEERAREAAGEAKALKASATARKQAISEKLAALK